MSEFQPVPSPEDYEGTPPDSGAVVPNQTGGAIGDLIEHIPEVIKETKSGFRTTEFWVSILAAVLVVVDGIPLPEKYEGIVTALIAAAYAISRGIAKQGIPYIEPATDEEA